MIGKLEFIIFILFCFSFASAQTLKKIAPNDARIRISGAPFSLYSDSTVVLQRHSHALLILPPSVSRINPVKAKTTSGVVLAFKTKSPEIRAHFKKLPGEQRGGSFAVFQDGVKTGEFAVNNSANSSLAFTIQNIDSQRESLFEITLPTWSNLAFAGLEIDSSYDLLDRRPVDKKRYVAYGNSITHGTGQKGTHETYAFQVARHFGWELYNVAVGGGKTSVVLADMLRDDIEHIDFITILIGFNDYNFQGVDTTEYKNRYNAVLSSIREKHKTAAVFCITQTFTKQDSSKTSGLPIADFRTALAHLVQERRAAGDKRLYLIRGEEMTSASQLKDLVHFSVEGAAQFADSLAARMEALLDSSAADVHGKSDAIHSAPAFYVYPNPADDHILIAGGRTPQDSTLDNILGQTVKFLPDKAWLSVADLPRGIYFLQLADTGRPVAVREIVLR